MSLVLLFLTVNSPLFTEILEHANDQAAPDKTFFSFPLTAYALTPITFHWDDWLPSHRSFFLLSDSKILCSHRQWLLLDWLTKLLHVRLSSTACALTPISFHWDENSFLAPRTGTSQITRDKWLDRRSSSLILVSLLLTDFSPLPSASLYHPLFWL